MALPRLASGRSAWPFSVSPRWPCPACGAGRSARGRAPGCSGPARRRRPSRRCALGRRLPTWRPSSSRSRGGPWRIARPRGTNWPAVPSGTPTAAPPTPTAIQHPPPSKPSRLRVALPYRRGYPLALRLGAGGPPEPLSHPSERPGRVKLGAEWHSPVPPRQSPAGAGPPGSAPPDPAPPPATPWQHSFRVCFVCLAKS